MRPGLPVKPCGAANTFFCSATNVSVEEEINLKQMSSEKGLLVMGPDCGTAIVRGIGLGFANKVRFGSIGIVAAAWYWSPAG